MKILSSNAGYLLGYEGSLTEYLTRPQRALIGSERGERAAVDRLIEAIATERPDVVCLLEVDQGSIRTRTDGQVASLADRLDDRGLDYHWWADNKYGDGVLARLPYLKHLSNGVLLRDGLDARSHYLDTGPKRLVTEVELAADVTLFAVHLAMGTRRRERQLRELTGLLADRIDGGERVIVAGDFNAYGGFEELDALRDRTGLRLHVPGETVPPRPLDDLVLSTRSLDLFLTPPSLDVRRCAVLDVQVSDHRPILLEVDLP